MGEESRRYFERKCRKVKRKRVEKTQMNKKRSAFSGKIGYVLSAAGASVGLGKYLEIPASAASKWRRNFPAGVYHTGTDLRVYYDRCGVRPWTYDKKKNPSWGIEVLQRGKRSAGSVSAAGSTRSSGTDRSSTLIGGWVVKYLFEYIRGNGSKLAEDGYFPDLSQMEELQKSVL